MHDVGAKGTVAYGGYSQANAVYSDAVADLRPFQNLGGADGENSGKPAPLDLLDRTDLLYDSGEHEITSLSRRMSFPKTRISGAERRKPSFGKAAPGPPTGDFAAAPPKITEPM